MARKIDEYVSALESVLPQNSREEIRLAMQRELRRRISPNQVGVAIGYVRRHCGELLWTIPHVKSSRKPDEIDRFYRIPCERDGSFQISQNNRDNFDMGAESTVKVVARVMLNMSASIQARLHHERSHIIREYLSDVDEQVMFTARRLARVIRLMEVQRNGTTG